MRLVKVTFFLISLSSSAFAQTVLQKAEQLLKTDSLTAAIETISPIDKLELTERPQALKILGSAYVKLQDNQSAIKVYEKLLQFSRQYYNPQDEIEALYWLTRINAIVGNFNKAIDYGKHGNKIAQLLDKDIWEFRINNFLSWAYFEQQIDFNEVLLLEKRQAELVEIIGNETQKAQVYNNLGYDLTVAGMVPLDSTINLMTYANDFYAENENNQGRWYTLMNLTWQYRLKGEHEKAIAFGEKSLKQAQHDNDRHAIIEASFQLGESLMAAEHLKEAEDYYSIGLQQSELKVDRDKFVFDVYYARYLWNTNQKMEAIDRLEKSVAFLVTSEVFYEMHGRTLLAEYYFQSGQVAQAQAQLDILANPRHNYIALETKFLAATTQAKIWDNNGEHAAAELLKINWQNRLQAIGAKMYTN